MPNMNVFQIIFMHETVYHLRQCWEKLSAFKTTVIVALEIGMHLN